MAVHQMTVNDADLPGDFFTYNLVGGSDQSWFTIDRDGNLRFLAAPDFETPSDVNSDNDYVVEVEVSDGINTVTQIITVTVTDVDESGIGFDSGNDNSNDVKDESGSNNPETEDIEEQEQETTEEIEVEEDIPVVNEDSFTENKSQDPAIKNMPKTTSDPVDLGFKMANEVSEDLDDVEEELDTNQPIQREPEAPAPVQKPSVRQGSIEATASATRLTYERLRNSLDDLEQETANDIEFSKTVVGSAVAASIGLSVGYVVWMIRGGMLLASVLSSMPAWQIADPLPILAGDKDDAESDDRESLEKIIKNGSKDAEKIRKDLTHQQESI